MATLPQKTGGGIPTDEKGVAGGVATLDGTGKIPVSQIPGGIGAGTVDSVNGVSPDVNGNVVISTTNIQEGTNLYYTQARFTSAFTSAIAPLDGRVSTLEADLASEITDRTNADSALDTRVTTLENDLADEITDRTNADSALDTRVTAVEGGLSNEITDRTNADSALDTRVTTLENDLADEITDRTNADSALDTRVTAVEGGLSNEITDRTNADSALDSRLSIAEADIDTLQADVLALTAGVDLRALEADLQQEITDRTNADNALDLRLDDVEAHHLHSNSYYVNDGVNDIQSVIDSISGGGSAYAIYVSAGSYVGDTITITDAPSGMVINGPYNATGVHKCEFLSRGLSISGANTTRIVLCNINVEGALLISDTQGRHYFKNCIFDSTVTINNACSNWVVFEDCSFSGGISIASTVTATVSFVRCTMNNQLVTSSRSGAGSPLLTILAECTSVNTSQTNLLSNVALVGRTGFNNNSVVQYQNMDIYVYDLSTGASTSFSGSYTELRNKPNIPTSTDSLTEGSTNLYFTTARARASISAGTGISITDGQISTTITQYTDADADARIALQKGANNGICELDANGLVPTNHLPPLAITDVHVVADETARLALTAQEGDVAIQQDDSSSWIYDGSTWVQFGLSGGVISVNGQTGVVSLDTDDITEGGTNLYYTDARFDTRLGTKTTDNLSEGATNLYFTTARARASISAGTGISITDGQISTTNTQYTDEQARDAVGTALANGVHTGISFLNNDSLDRIDATVSLSGFTTDDLLEGATNKYTTASSVRPLLSATAPIVYTSATGVISTTLTQYTDELAQDAAASLFTGGTHTGITYTYNDASNKIDSTVSISGDSLTWPTVALNTGTTAVSVGNYYYTSTTAQGSAYTLTPPSPGKNGDILYVHNNGGNTINFGSTAYYFDSTYSGVGQTFTSTENDVFVFTRFGTGNVWFISKQVSHVRYTDALARTASVVNSMAGSQTTQAPSVSAIKAYYAAGTGITLTSGTIASTITQYTDELAQDASASLLTTGTHTGISYSYVDGSNKIDSTVSLAGFSIDALSDVDTSTTPPTSGQALAWDGTSKWIPTTIGGSAGGGSRPSYTTVSSFPLTISAPASSVIKERYYLNNGASAATVNLPAVASCDGLEIVIKLLGTGTATIDASGSETIDGALTFALTLQNSSVNLIATSAGWRIE